MVRFSSPHVPLLALSLGLSACDASPSPDEFEGLDLLDPVTADENEDELDPIDGELDESIPAMGDLATSEGSHGQTVVEGPDGLMVVTYENIDGIAFVDGDIELGPVSQLPRFDSVDLNDPDLDLDQLPRALTPVPLWGQAWPNGVVFYVAPDTGSPDVDSTINDAIATVAAETDLNFVAVPLALSFAYSHIYFSPSWSLSPNTGSSDSIGRKGGRQYIRMSMLDVILDDSPGEGLFIHELVHAVGLYHEHQRADRDDHVLYQWWCVEAGKAHNFDKRLGFALGPYDPSSIMHYWPNSFSTGPGCPTLVSTTGASLGSNTLSASDIAALDWLASF